MMIVIIVAVEMTITHTLREIEDVEVEVEVVSVVTDVDDTSNIYVQYFILKPRSSICCKETYTTYS